jgi:hypothetical protein
MMMREIRRSAVDGTAASSYRPRFPGFMLGLHF